MSSPSFSGETAEFYLRYRRDLPADQAARLSVMAQLRPDDVLIDLGCGTGQIAVPMSEHCDVVVAVDPEAAMLAGLRSRAAERVVCVLDDDRGLKRLGSSLRRPVGAVTIGNALHWMDEAATLDAAASVLRTGGAVCIVSQGPPMWLGHAPWQIAIRRVLEHQLGSVSDNCRTDSDALARTRGPGPRPRAHSRRGHLGRRPSGRHRLRARASRQRDGLRATELCPCATRARPHRHRQQHGGTGDNHGNSRSTTLISSRDITQFADAQSEAFWSSHSRILGFSIGTPVRAAVALAGAASAVTDMGGER